MSHITLVVASSSQVMQYGIYLILEKITESIKITPVKNYDEFISAMSSSRTGMMITDGTVPYVCIKESAHRMPVTQPWLDVAIYRTEEFNKNMAFRYLSNKLVRLERASGIATFQDTIASMLLHLKMLLRG